MRDAEALALDCLSSFTSRTKCTWCTVANSHRILLTLCYHLP